MRWESLFDDLEAQFDAEQMVEFAAEVADRTRRELALVRLIDRLRPMRGASIGVRVAGVGGIDGVVSGAGPGWLLLRGDGGREVLIASSAIMSISRLGSLSSAPHAEGEVAAKIGLAYVLRAIARDRSPVAVHYVDSTVTPGTIDRVGVDFFEVAEHPASELRRVTAVRDVRTVPFAALAVIRRA